MFIALMNWSMTIMYKLSMPWTFWMLFPGVTCHDNMFLPTVHNWNQMFIINRTCDSGCPEFQRWWAQTWCMIGQRLLRRPIKQPHDGPVKWKRDHFYFSMMEAQYLLPWQYWASLSFKYLISQQNVTNVEFSRWISKGIWRGILNANVVVTYVTSASIIQ